MRLSMSVQLVLLLFEKNIKYLYIYIFKYVILFIMPQHIKRLIGAFALVFVLFLVMQQVLKPGSFGKLGHYRADAILENKMKAVHYAGSDKCTECHEDMASDKSVGFHAQLQCEVCHGPGLKHAMYADKFKDGELPDSLKLNKPDQRKDCAICHQVNTKEHNLIDKRNFGKLVCIDCHNPHQP
jgi:hypothetical protein